LRSRSRAIRTPTAGRFGDRRRPRSLQGEVLGRNERDRGRPRVRAAYGSTSDRLAAHRPPPSFPERRGRAGPAAVPGSCLPARSGGGSAVTGSCPPRHKLGLVAGWVGPVAGGGGFPGGDRG